MTPSPEQQDSIKKMAREITRVAPNEEKEFIEFLSTEVLGPLPSFSTLPRRSLNDVEKTTNGAFVLCYAYDTRENVVVIIERGKKSADGQQKLGLPGGYVNLSKTEASTFIEASEHGEQPAEGAVRELREEVLVLNINPKRLTQIMPGNSYRYVDTGGNAVHYDAFKVRLSPNELADVKALSEKLKIDPEYKATFLDETNGEVSNVLLVPLSEAAAKDSDQFEHKHELKALKLLAKRPGRRITIQRLGLNKKTL